MTPTTQFRIPLQLKSLFKQVCAIRNQTISGTVIQLITGWVNEQTRDPDLLRRLRQFESSKQPDPFGTNAISESTPDDWRNNI
jgi:hypothetical protein